MKRRRSRFKRGPTAYAPFDAMVAARPKTPPPLPRETARVRTAGELALLREKRLGMHGVEYLWIRNT